VSSVGSQGKRVLIGTDIPVKFFKQLKSDSAEAVAWRDAGRSQGRR
jgi:hypothetical protein